MTGALADADSPRHALILSGTGRYADPWHPFAETSTALAGLLQEAGFRVQTADDVDATLAALAVPDGAAPELLVVNVGLPRDGKSSPETPEASAGLRRWLGDGRPMLVSHVSATSFLDFPEWEGALGGRWIRGTSMHPEYGRASIRVRRKSGALVEGIADFELPDERYSYLRTTPAITVHATHAFDGFEHPVMWSLDRGPGRTFYDALGHDAASYESPEHRELLLRAVAWLTAS